MSGRLFRCAAIVAVCLASFAQAPTTPAPMTVQQILTRMLANDSGLKTYQVPVSIDAHVHKVITVPVSISGTRYFKAPDKEALKTHAVPAIAKGFENIYASLGTPATWPQTYDITQVAPSISRNRATYELRGVYKRPSKVDHILLDVDALTFDPVQARWYYSNGATVVMNIEERIVDGKYRLPTHETVDVNFPGYRGTAVVNYGDYVTNKDISDTVFTHE